jgi:hypothetical protein
MPRRNDSGAVESGDVLTLEGDLAGFRHDRAGNQVKERALAGTVRADDGGQGALGEAERHVVDRGNAPETFGQAGDDN